MSIKSIYSPADLAINGAPPTYAEPLHVGRPNVGDREAFMARVEHILDSQWLTNDGPMVHELEQRLGAYLGVKHCVAMCNGTIALEIAIRALGLTGEVIVPSWTFVATAHALYWQGIKPVFADIDPATHNLDPEAVRAAITPRTSGIIGVHLWGRAAPVDALQALADEHKLTLMFDAAHAFSGTFRGQHIGRFGACEAFSFHATKAFNAIEGGAVTTNDDELADTMRLMRNFGFAGYDNVIHPGTNGKMNEVSAAMGLTNLDGLDAVIAINRRNQDLYRAAFADLPGVSLLARDATEQCNHHYAVIEVEPSAPGRRDRIVAALQAENILARKYFWPGCHHMRPYRDLYPDAGQHLPHTEAVAERVIVLPNGPQVDADVAAVVRDVIQQVDH